MVNHRVAIVGCGLIGRKRAAALPAGTLRVACDLSETSARELARNDAEWSVDWEATVARDDIDVVVVATTHDQLARVATAAARNGKHVLLEKPGARRSHELAELEALVADGNVVVHVGFNHRYHPAFIKARELVDAGAIGTPQYVRARYGHGGRPGYDREWRADARISGGGQAIDQSMHLIDLARWFLGDFSHVDGAIATYFWDMPVEDNAFLLLRTAAGGIAQLHASWTEWKNLFSFELFGRDGKLDVSGLGGSYGTERLTFYHMLPEMGPPETTAWEYPMADDSWRREVRAFFDDIAALENSSPGVNDARRALDVVERLYERNGP
ncbi:MAG: Gfo/Idh/MocA family oxidoreductase [Candidatus Eremiobacteraeota bacterium]|nr:Gfo/Idh/MocA family oxidoreductase [Candidatus Eremiobacteraeota bacterium]